MYCICKEEDYEQHAKECQHPSTPKPANVRMSSISRSVLLLLLLLQGDGEGQLHRDGRSAHHTPDLAGRAVPALTR
jgi:hypothetical protein